VSNDKMREEFEAWLRTLPEVLNVGYNIETGRYFLDEDQDRWEAWQASRAAIVVELPKPHFEFDGDTAPEMMAREVVKSIEAAGLKVKP